jgi:hypothetical protein
VGLNRFAYGKGDPVNHTDRSGNECWNSIKRWSQEGGYESGGGSLCIERVLAGGYFTSVIRERTQVEGRPHGGHRDHRPSNPSTTQPSAPPTSDPQPPPPVEPDPPSSDPVNPSHLVAGVEGAVIPFVGIEGAAGIYLTLFPQFDAGVTLSTPEGIHLSELSLGADFGVDGYIGWTSSLNGSDLNINGNMTILPVGVSITTDPKQTQGLTGVNFTTGRGGASLSRTYTRSWSMRRLWNRFVQ